MARPLSEVKRQAIMTAATDLVAKLGVGASTAKIAEAAGLAVGTMFTYFASKDELFSELLIEIETDLARSLVAPDVDCSDRRECLLTIWNRLVNWGVTNPSRRLAMKHLRAYERINSSDQQSCKEAYREVMLIVHNCLTGYVAPDRASFYTNTVMMGLAEVVIEAIAHDPGNKEHLQQSGFDLFWKGIAA